MSHPDHPFGEEAHPVDPVARQSVELPATFILVMSLIATCFSVMSLFLSPLALLGDEFRQSSNATFEFMGNAVVSLFQTALCGFVAWAAWQMRGLKSYPLAMAASVIMCVPCLAPCCPFGIPVGIWALVVLNKPEVKAAFEAAKANNPNSY